MTSAASGRGLEKITRDQGDHRELTTGDIASHLADVYRTEVSRDLVSRVTDAVVEQMQQSAATG